jgi:predicted dehydrogenase
MNESNPSGASRRDFLKRTGTVAAASTLLAARANPVHAAQDSTIQLALVGCGGRGAGAAVNALSVQNGPLKMVAMADVFEHKLKNSFSNLQRSFKDKVDVPAERKFIGFDGYQQAMDCLKPGDVVILTTPPAFRWVQFKYAIEKGLNVFMEKPVTVDGPSTRKMLALGEASVKKNLKVGVGLMCRHCEARGELFDRIQNGEIGDVVLLRAYRMAGPTASEAAGPKPEGMSELLYQIQNFHSFLWASGGCYSDFLIHNIDESCWMKNAWPVEAKAIGARHYRGKAVDQNFHSFLWASGGCYSDFLIHNIDESCWMKNAWPVEAKAIGARHYRGKAVDQNFDNYSVEYTFADGAKLLLDGRTMPGCYQEFASYAHGAKGSAVISTAGHSPARSRIYKGQNMSKENLVWRFDRQEPNPYQLEWNHLIEAIRSDTPYNEVQRGAEASLVASMGRMAAHTGQRVAYDDILNCEHEFAPTVDKLTLDGPAPLLSDANGKYPVPMPGLNPTREY